jgi:predicted O-methyltransferase YrrM
MYEDLLRKLTKTVLSGKGDSDRHVMALFAIALASKGKRYLEIGVRSGRTTLPLLLAAHLNRGHLTSVDIQDTDFVCPAELKSNWRFVKSDAISFLESLDCKNPINVIYIDDWHAYGHVKKELEIIDRLIGPSSVVLLHDLMWGNHAPFYHCELTLKKGQWAEGGPYRAVSELDPQFWEWSTLPWSNGLTVLRKKYSTKYHSK